MNGLTVLKDHKWNSICDLFCVIEKEEKPPKSKYIRTLMKVVEDAKVGWLLLLLLGVAGDRPGHQDDGQDGYHEEDFHFSRSIKLGNLNAKLCLGASVVSSVYAWAVCVCDRW